MPTLVVQPNKTLPIPKKECIKYCIVPFEYILINGQPATAYMEFDGTAYGSGIDFVFAGQDFTTSASATTTRNTFQIPANGLIAANNFKSSLEKNAYFFEYTEITVVDMGGGTWRTVVTWIEYAEQPDWTFDYSAFAPAIGHGETQGVDFLLRDGFKLRYQLYGENADGVFPITRVESVTPRINNLGVPRMCFNFQDDVLPFLSTTFPGLGVTTVTFDELFKIEVFLKYGGVQNSNCTITDFDFEGTDRISILNAVIQIDVQDKLKPHHYPTTKLVSWFTSRPDKLPVPSTCEFWLWAWMRGIEEVDYTKYRAAYTYYDVTGATISTEIGPEITQDGIFIVPAGPANVLNLPATAVRYEVFIEGFSVPLADWERVTKKHTVRIQDKCDWLELYFLEDLGGYSPIHFHEYEELVHVQENQVFELPESCPDDIHSTISIGSRLRGGGQNRANIKSWIVYKAKIDGMDLPELEDWYRQFRDSENVLLRYVNPEGTEVVRRVILEPGETTIMKDGEYLSLETVFRFHTDLR